MHVHILVLIKYLNLRIILLIMRFNKYLIFNRFIIMDKIVCRKNGKNNKYKKLILNNNIHLLKVIKLCIDINYYNP
jgi:hypothetical protein